MGRALSFSGAVLLAGLLGALPAGCAPPAQGAGAGLEVRLRPVEVPAEIAADGGRIGRLELLAAYELAGPSESFGGLSALRLVGPDLLLLSDRGRLYRARRVEDGAGRLEALRDWAELRLPRRLREADTEALAVLPDGRLVVGAEDLDELVRLAPDGARADGTIPLPEFLRAAPENEGLETLAALPDGGGLLAVAEGLAAGLDLVAAARLDGRGGAVRLAARAPDDFKPTDAAAAGRTLFLLQRRLSLLGGLEARLVAVPLERALGAGPLDGEELARFGPGSLGENFEGVAAREADPGRYLLYLVADDNFSPLQRSLLLQLSWRPAAAGGAP